MFFGMWRSLQWLGKNFLIPIKDRVIEHINQLDKATVGMMELIKHQGELIRNQTDSIQKQNKVLDHMDKTIQSTGIGTTDNTETLNRIDSNVKDLKERATLFFHESHKSYVKRDQEPH